MLTDIKIKAVKPAAKLQKLTDGGGLFLEVAKSGKKTFRLTYRCGGERRTMTVGDWPRTRLTEARHRRSEVKMLLEMGQDPRDTFGPFPRDEDAVVAPGLTWANLMQQYLAKRAREGAADATIKKMTLHADLTIRHMGETPVREITAKDVIECCRVYEDQGKLNSAHAVRALISQAFRFAVALGEADTDPAAFTREAIARPKNPGYPGITSPRRIGQLMRAIRGYKGEPAVRTGLLLSAYLFPRNKELRLMRWDQLSEDTWTIPAEQMKKKREHLVPLPRQVIDLLEMIKQLSYSADGLVLTSMTSPSGVLSENTFNHALRRMGFPKEEHVHHGFRITASTTLHEQGWNSDWIEMQLAHVEENKVKGAYNRALYLDGRREMLQAYADWLDEQAAQT